MTAVKKAVENTGLLKQLGLTFPGLKEGYQKARQIMTDDGKYRHSVFSPAFYQELREAGVTPTTTPGQFLGAYGTRLLTDVGSDSTRQLYWRYNHPMALADVGFQKALGPYGQTYSELDPLQRAAIGSAVAAPVAVSLGIYDVTNIGELGRQRGFAQNYAAPGSADRRQTDQPGLEVIDRFALGRRGRPLKYETAKQDIPNLTPERYSNYMRSYYQDKGLTGLGLVKFTPENLEGYPEARIVGFPVGLQAAGALAGGATAGRYAMKAAYGHPSKIYGVEGGLPGPKLKGDVRTKATDQIVKRPGRARTVAATTAVGATAGALLGNTVNQIIAAANRPKLPTTQQYQDLSTDRI